MVNTIRLIKYLGEGFSERDADPSLLHPLLEVLDAILAIIIISSYGAHPGPAKVQHQVCHGCSLMLIIGNGPQEGGELELTLQCRA